jgi:ATPase subunit of ABC transporter with duplicated ATPase domains
MSQLLIQLSRISISFGQQPLFEDISLSIHQGECCALIGENGAGKTTLLRLLAGPLAPEEGEVHRAAGLTIGFLPQEIIIDTPSQLVRTYLEEGPLTDLEKMMEGCLIENRLDEWEKLHEEYEHKGGYQQLPLEQIMKGLHLEPLFDRTVSSLSSGQRIRVALAKTLIDNPDVLLLDEPTNHLDHSMRVWLQNVLRNRRGATVVVSHDRKFLNAACSHLIEIGNGRLTRYCGGYGTYLEAKKREIERQISAYEIQQEEKEAIRQKIKALTFSKRKPPPPSDRNIMAYDKRGECHQKSVHRTLEGLKS